MTQQNHAISGGFFWALVLTFGWAACATGALIAVVLAR